ncbi:MAG: polyphosphate kinase 2 family protein [Deltaproteobacteria bacterium]|nr:polyphosphate kinase 2 family protein [Deltaproteobacteria bacterium]
MAPLRSQRYVIPVNGRRKFHLTELDPSETWGLDKEAARAHAEPVEEEFRELADLLAYAASHSLLVIIQGRDAAGKDGCVRKILSVANVQTVRVTAFKVPSAAELAHDYLWRIHKEAPQKGDLAIFNRSHYEDVVAVRVHELAPKSIWQKRYAQINSFEEVLSDAKTIVVKFFLHISADEQEQRLLEREKDPRKFWKLNPSDWLERDAWDKTTEAYEDVFNKCSSPERPWHIVPANKKWFRDIAVLKTLVSILRPYKEVWMEELQKMGVHAKAAIAQARRHNQSLAAAQTKAKTGKTAKRRKAKTKEPRPTKKRKR